MKERTLRRTPIPKQAAITRHMDAYDGPPLRLPGTKAEFDALLAIAECDLRPARRGRPAQGQRGPVTRTRSIRAPDTLWRRLEALAKRRGVTVNQAAVQALEALTG